MRLPVHGREITLEDLASHRSGLPRLPRGLLWRGLTLDRRDPYARFDRPTFEAAIAATPPRREPGRKVVYSNYGMGLLGYVLACRAGMSYERLVRARICEQLRLVDTWIETPESERWRVADGHTRRGRETPLWNLGALAGAGGLQSTVADLLAFLRIHTRRSDSALAVAASETHSRRAGWRKAGIGLGWLIAPPSRLPWARLPSEVLFHEGGTGGFRSFAALAPEAGAAVVVLANQARGVGRLGFRVLQATIREHSPT